MDNRDMRHLKRRLPTDVLQRIDATEVLEGEEMRLFRYGTDGAVDLDLYRQLQTEANKMKIENQWVPEEHIEILSNYMVGAGWKPKTGICHGTRRGNEQVWFRKHLPTGAVVIGTEISDTATEFPYTIQWDFHDVDPAWVGKTGFVYSNSWDHAHDPERAFAGWIRCLKKGGYLMLDHGWNYQPDRVSAMDPFGISQAGLIKMLNRIGEGVGKVVEVIEGGKHRNKKIETVIFRADKTISASRAN
jgi:hypothetical protein